MNDSPNHNLEKAGEVTGKNPLAIARTILEGFENVFGCSMILLNILTHKVYLS